MRIHSPQKIKKIKELRRHGYSINELVRELSIPKTTIWHHIKGVDVLPKYLETLRAKRGGSKKIREKNLQIAEKRADSLLKKTDKNLAIVLAMLYWGEGSKKVCEFINSDGKMIQVYLKILRNYLNIPNNHIKITIRYFSGMNRNDCLKYWSKITGVSWKEFIIRFNDGGTRGKTKYGMCRITVRRGHNTLKLIHALISKTSNKILNIAN